jgi:hypothetical protein
MQFAARLGPAEPGQRNAEADDGDDFVNHDIPLEVSRALGCGDGASGSDSLATADNARSADASQRTQEKDGCEADCHQ